MEYECVGTCEYVGTCVCVHRDKNENVNEDIRLIQVVRVAILLALYQCYCLGIEAVQEPVGARLDAPVPLALRKQRE